MDTEGLVKKSRIAESLDVSVRTVNRWVERGEIPCHKRGKLIRFKLSEVLGWFACSGRKQHSEPEAMERKPAKKQRKRSGNEIDLATFCVVDVR